MERPNETIPVALLGRDLRLLESEQENVKLVRRASGPSEVGKASVSTSPGDWVFGGSPANHVTRYAFGIWR